MWWDGDGTFLPDADSNKTLIHADNHVALTHISVVSTITRVAVEQKIITLKIWEHSGNLEGRFPNQST